MSEFVRTKRSTVVRAPKKACYKRDEIYAILDEALISQVGFVANGQPFVTPVNHWRVGDNLYFHGSSAGRRIRIMEAGADLCVSVTLLDGLVFARSAMHHGMNFRSAMIFGRARLVEDEAEKLAALKALLEHLAPGRWAEVRPPNASEMKITKVLVMSLDEASAKLRSGPPADDEEDYALDVWAGEVPLRQVRDAPISDPRLAAGVEVPGYLPQDDT
ncbi:MAG TPA: pyridoxamine 5'-phosphate oxidase family protein [Alphaproteobacteria bacterium]|jgi:hypothetical protein|nr:pyridoxamine 5'-phosphate oxidase family protein [Alphaproteobacteria bacterium]HJM51187.1 pyridoxamine 5'-phosphate oxidase family protein [Alphaproteobacteria bacterium]